MRRTTREAASDLRGALRRLGTRRRAPRPAATTPWAQPRPRFDIPAPRPEPAGATSEVPDVPPAEGRETPGRASSASARPTITQRPIYTGFMVTVGVGLALLFYYVAVNVGALGGWITGAMFIALGLDPLVRWIESRGLPRPVGVGAVLLLLAGLATLLATVVIPNIARQALEFLNNFPDTFDRFLQSDIMVSLNQQFGIRDRVDAEAENFFSNLFSDSNVVGSFLNSLVNAGSTIAQVITGTLIVMFLALYFLASLPTIKAWGVRLAPTSKRPRVEELTEKITRSVGNYVMGQAIVALLNATVAFILMSILGVPFALLTAFVVALLAFVPLIGGVVAGILVTFIALLQGWQTALIYAACYFAYLQVEAYFVSPRIMKRAVAVPAAVAVIAVAGGGALWGVLGAIVAIPVAASGLLLLREILIPLQDRS